MHSQPTVLLHVGELEIEELQRGLNRYDAMFVVEPRGTGKQLLPKGSQFHEYSEEASSANYAHMLGKTMQGMRVLDVLAAMRILRSMEMFNSCELHIAGQDEHALTALLTAVIEGIHEVRLRNLLQSYLCIAEHTMFKWEQSIFAIDILRHFDIDDLLASIVPGTIEIDGIFDHNKKRINAVDANHLFPKTVNLSQSVGSLFIT